MFGRVFWASFKRAMVEYWRYPSSWQKGLFWNPIQFILPFMYGLQALSGDRMGAETTGFVLLGTLCWAWLNNAMWDATGLLQREFHTGTLETVFLTPAPRIAWLLGSVTASSVMHSWVSLFSGVLAFFLFPFPLAPHWAAVIVYALLVFALGWGLAFAASGAMLYLKRANNILSVFVDATLTMSGVTFPIQSAPRWLYSLALVIPFAPAVTGLRQALMGQGDLSGAYPVLLGLAVAACLLLAAGIYLFKLMERQVRKNATLHTY